MSHSPCFFLKTCHRVENVECESHLKIDRSTHLPSLKVSDSVLVGFANQAIAEDARQLMVPQPDAQA
jgi:hypothetical protein